MGREIRRVPADWEHPRDKEGQYIPLHDKDYETAAQEWTALFLAWENGTAEDRKRGESCGCRYLWEWQGPPDEETHRKRKWTAEEATHYQVYETVSEGTPVSPVFASLPDMVEWLVGEGFTWTAAERFAHDGWAPSFMMQQDKDGHMRMSGIGVASLDFEFTEE